MTGQKGECHDECHDGADDLHGHGEFEQWAIYRCNCGKELEAAELVEDEFVSV